MLCLAVTSLERRRLWFLPSVQCLISQVLFRNHISLKETSPPMDSVYAETNTTFCLCKGNRVTQAGILGRVSLVHYDWFIVGRMTKWSNVVHYQGFLRTVAKTEALFSAWLGFEYASKSRAAGTLDMKRRYLKVGGFLVLVTCWLLVQQPFPSHLPC